ncbi:MAG: sialidase family protein, partial [Acidobacteria bacterium]|nr:sialidase family protein [Acidobacteriota bacterium]
MFSLRRPSALCRSFCSLILLVAIALAAASSAVYGQQQIVAGQNVNMVGGPWSFDPATGRIVGDPFLQRQNEPSLALSSRNPCHLLAGANDYRAVDVPGLPGDTETGDAWIGVMKSIDCGQTWTSTLLPGYPQDKSPEGMASPLKGLAAGADATVRPGPGGLFYYSGVAFNRGSNELGKVFVARFIDDNNKEQGDPMRYVGAVAVDSGTSGQFLDKPWVAADIPRGNATCTVDGQTVPAGPVYLTYTSFVGGTNNPRSKIMFAKSTDCGATWSNPSKLSERIALNQGTVLAINPVDGAIYIAWREFADPSLDPNNLSTVHGILFVKSTDGGKSFSKAVAIDSALHPFDQGSSPVSFRTNAYPTMAVDGTGRIYVAWAARGFATPWSDPLTGDARIVLSTSSDGGSTWSMPRSLVDNYPGAGHQLMPTLTFAAGKLVIAYYDLRDDVAGVFAKYVDEGEAVRLAGKRHTIELRAAMADPAGAPAFTSYTTVSGDGTLNPSTQVSQYLMGNLDRAGARSLGVRLQYNPPNLPIFAQGTIPFIGDYIDIAGQTFTLDASRVWKFNTQADPTGKRVPLFHVTWTDNRDVRRPPAGQTWASYKSPTIGPTGKVCDPGSNPGSRNQNIYTAPLMPGLVVTAPGNQKTLGRIQRAFVVYVRNTTSADHYYTLSIAPPPTGSYASFTRIDETQLANPNLVSELGSVYIPRRSSIARSVFIVAPGTAYPFVTVNVSEIGTGGATVAQAAVVLNADVANPDIANPDIANPDIANPDIANAEVYNPDIANVTVDNPDMANTDIANPDIA